MTSSEPNADVVHDVWIEDQVIYPRSPVPPGDILTLAKSAHRLAGRYDSLGVVVHFVEPSKWKGQVPCTCAKTGNPAACTHHSRVWKALDAREQGLVTLMRRVVAKTLQHNVYDALGLGQWARKYSAFGRMQ